MIFMSYKHSPTDYEGNCSALCQNYFKASIWVIYFRVVHAVSFLMCFPTFSDNIPSVNFVPLRFYNIEVDNMEFYITQSKNVVFNGARSFSRPWLRFSAKFCIAADQTELVCTMCWLTAMENRVCFRGHTRRSDVILLCSWTFFRESLLENVHSVSLSCLGNSFKKDGWEKFKPCLRYKTNRKTLLHL